MVEFENRTGELIEQKEPSIETIISGECDRVSSRVSRHSNLLNHDYDVIQTGGAVQAHVMGFIARRIIRLTKCCLCIDTMRHDSGSMQIIFTENFIFFDRLIFLHTHTLELSEF